MNEQSILKQLQLSEQAPASLMTEITEITANELFEKATATQNASEIIENGPAPGPEPGPLNQPTPQNSGGGSFNEFRQAGNVNIGKVVNAKFAVTLLDNTIPLLFIVIMRVAFNKKTTKKQYQLSAKEREDIEPFIQDALNTLNINFNNPWTALAVVLTALYGSKGAEVAIDSIFEQENASEAPKNTGIGFNMDGTPKKDGRGRPRK